MKKMALILSFVPALSGCFIATGIQGNGQVTSPGGHDCGAGTTNTCTVEYPGPGTETFTAEADPGHTFSKWSNCTYETLDTCQTVAWNQAMADNGLAGYDTWTVIATFTEQNSPVRAAQYTYNALGQRITRTVNGQTTIFQYDLDGNLMAEIDAATGQPLREHVHVNGEPVAQISTNPGNGAVTVDYVHADHLGTPTLLTNSTGAVVADIESTPFGERFIDYAEVTYNRRFPGQYRDGETGLHYNYFREYDPSLGRYIQSDPIGLDGGLNSYAYANMNPLVYTDPHGLLGASGVRKRSNHPAELVVWDGASSTRCRLRCSFDPSTTVAGEAAKGGLSRAGALGKAIGSRANLGLQAFGMAAAFDCMAKCREDETNACYNPDNYNPYFMSLAE